MNPIHSSLRWLACSAVVLASSLAQAQPATLEEAAKKTAAAAGCFACHTTSHQDLKGGQLPIGPAWQDVAAQYRGKPGAAEFLTRLVLEGSNP